MTRAEGEAAVRRELAAHIDGLLRLARILVTDREAAGDLVQDTLLRALERTDQLRSAARCRAWLRAILRSVHRSGLRRARAGVTVLPARLLTDLDTVAATPAVTPLTLLERRRTGEAVERALGRVPSPYRHVVRLVAFHGLSYREVAHEVGCPVGTVKSRLRRGRTLLRAALVEAGIAREPRARVTSRLARQAVRAQRPLPRV